MDLKKNETVQRVYNILKKYDKNQSLIVLETSARTAKEAATSLGCKVGAIVKSLIFKSNDKYYLCLISGDKRASESKIKSILKVDELSMASATDVKQVTGFSIGGVSPIGHLNKLNVLIDLSLERYEQLFAAAGHPHCIFRINYRDLIKITNGLPNNITEWDNQI